ncbi:DUF3099 domain-containing protein [Antrihabitans cavernicola]|uniref:DUF3099 domain-containing protein n=1 Tax=Antrihabitans cavernicola TaxID=2495913 RepID=A0A5A7SGP3_9NOCA|nr:DUF3099 domain-containing protein [Spelaeibacter cavernicola]KAA0023381.1 DUF3099 domain-containing protein [Spelaeibacter cavernicola]
MARSAGPGRPVGFFREPVESGSPGRPAVITAAAQSVEEQHRARVKKYTIIMSFRIPALILAAVAYSAFENPLVSILIIAASVPLPWIAVLIANDRPPRKKNEPRTYNYGTIAPSAPAIESPHHTIDG